MKMKNRILPLFTTIVMFSGLLFGCDTKETEYLLTKITMYDADGVNAGEMFFDDYKNITKSTLIADGTVIFSSESEYEYDEYGNYVKCSYTSDADSYVEEYKYEYDDDGNIIACEGYKDGESKGEYKYEDGNLVALTTYDSNGDVLGTETYEYDENSNLMKKSISDAQARTETIYEYSYDEHGNDSGCVQTVKIGTIEQTVTMENENEYDDNGNLIKQSLYNVTGEEREFLGTYEFEYKEKE